MNKTLKKWYVYLLECSDKTYYCGITTDINRRISEHNTSSRSAKYTRSRRPVSLIGCLEAESRSDALKKEISIKKMNRKEKLKLFSTGNSYK
tara:strand:+ start:1463 stop:1738 length:276 start_codon:yes stop_codon:yes gene_type:complete